jgi:hypothetical protein
MKLTILVVSILLKISVASDDCPASGVVLPGAVYLCQYEDFKGPYCEWHAPSDTCFSLQSDTYKSIGPDPGGYCIFWPYDGCGADRGNQTAIYVDGQWRS